MGADGSIEIFDLQKAEDKFGTSEMSKFLEFICDSQTYIQTMTTPKKEKFKVLSVYQGSNMWLVPLFDQIASNSFDDDYSEREFQKYLKSKEIIDYLVENCGLSYWEVWT